MSDYLKTSTNARVYIPIIGTTNVNGCQLFIHDKTGGLLAAPKFASPDEAEIELVAVNEQLDAWEQAQQEKAQATKVAKGFRR